MELGRLVKFFLHGLGLNKELIFRRLKSSRTDLLKLIQKDLLFLINENYGDLLRVPVLYEALVGAYKVPARLSCLNLGRGGRLG